jgi:hypothetical protein
LFAPATSANHWPACFFAAPGRRLEMASSLPRGSRARELRPGPVWLRRGRRGRGDARGFSSALRAFGSQQAVAQRIDDPGHHRNGSGAGRPLDNSHRAVGGPFAGDRRTATCRWGPISARRRPQGMSRRMLVWTKKARQNSSASSKERRLARASSGSSERPGGVADGGRTASVVARPTSCSSCGLDPSCTNARSYGAELS